MKDVQKTSIFGIGGLAVALTTAKTLFMDVPVDEFIIHLHSLTINQMFEVIVPLVLGTVGIIYDEEKKK